MIWANNSEFCFFVNLRCFKAKNYHFKARNGFYALILVRSDISHDCDSHIFCYFFKIAAGGHLGFYLFEKKTLEFNLSPPGRF